METKTPADSVFEQLVRAFNSPAKALEETVKPIISNQKAVDKMEALEYSGSFREELVKLINKFSLEDESETPDYILAEVMLQAMDSFDKNVKERDRWYGDKSTGYIKDLQTSEVEESTRDPNKVYFYKNKEHWTFSNFAALPIVVDGKEYPTTEHYYQAMKFFDEDTRELIRTAATPLEARKLGNKKSFPIRTDWEEVKESVMFGALLKKAFKHNEFHTDLLSTGNKEIVEDSPHDYYWGTGEDGTGENKMGKLLMRLRDLLR